MHAPDPRQVRKTFLDDLARSISPRPKPLQINQIERPLLALYKYRTSRAAVRQLSATGLAQIV